MKNILHIIESLDTGGAELLLVKYLPELRQGYQNTIVYLRKPDNLLLKLEDYEVIFLIYKNHLQAPAAIRKLRRIIQKNKIDIVHTHLFIPTILARLACPKTVKFIFHVHSILSDDAFKHNSLAQMVEKLTYQRNQTAIFVSESVKEDYQTHIGLKGEFHILYNFVDNTFFDFAKVHPESWHQPIRMVAVGNLKVQKNYLFLVKVFSQLKGFPVTLDIYGEGPLCTVILNQLKAKGIANIRLKGYERNLASLLQTYDIFIAASENEGFCIAVAEAMVVGLPCLLSDIKTFREISAGNAVFFNPKDEQDLIEKIRFLQDHKHLLAINTGILKERVKYFTVKQFISRLQAIYNA